MTTPSIISERRQYSAKRLEDFQSEVQKKAEFRNASNLCIYVTGSYGRQEASEYSDLDLFFVHSGSRSENDVTKSDKAILDASLIKIAEGMNFPPFSKGGEYLTIHHSLDILKALGSPADDYHNYFTARLLLLLESKCIYNQDIYDQTKTMIINSYYRDYHDHERDFQPIFLVNDILRFWRTLCLNYEHNRERPEPTKGEEEKSAVLRRKSYIKNLKLKYSRLLTCYSAIAAILAAKGAISDEQMLAITNLTPIQRLDRLIDENPSAKEHVAAVIEGYALFLETTAKNENELLDWIGSKDNRQKAFSEARSFGKSMYSLLSASSDSDKLRYLVI